MVLVQNTDDKPTNSAIIDTIQVVDMKLNIVKRYLETQQNRSDDIEYLNNLYEELQALITKGNLMVNKIYALMERINENNQE